MVALSPGLVRLSQASPRLRSGPSRPSGLQAWYGVQVVIVSVASQGCGEPGAREILTPDSDALPLSLDTQMSCPPKPAQLAEESPWE